MYVFGEESQGTKLSESELKKILARASVATESFAKTPLMDIIEVLDRLGQTWTRNSENWKEAFAITRKEVAFSDEMIAYSLDVIPDLLNRRHLLARVKADFGRVETLDEFIDSGSFAGRSRAFPLGTLFHVSAGNVFLGAIDSLLMGFLTKNISVVKLSSRNLSFPMLFASSLKKMDHKNILSDKFSLIHFPGGSTNLEQILKEHANAIIAWGGEEMIQSYKKSLPMGLKFIEYGPKISFQVVTKTALERTGYDQVGKWIAQDVAMWDQAACASPQNLFFEEGIDCSALLSAIANAFAAFPYSRGTLTDDERVEILKEKARAIYDKIMNVGDYREGREYFIHFEKSPGLRTSPLNRSLIVKSFRDVADLRKQVSTFGRYLQSCGLLAMDEMEEQLIQELGQCGVMRFAHLGQVMQAPIGTPHDGKMTLVELTRMVPEERDATLEGQINDAIAHVPFYRDLRQGKFVNAVTDMPLISGSELDSGNKEKLARYTHSKMGGGYIFSSGGTSGAPKYSLYSHAEFKQVAELLAVGFAAQGIEPGMTVGNLFVAGNMWSSFLAVDQALIAIGARTLPIGGLTEHDQILSYLEQFQPSFIVGLPTQILEVARRAEERQLKLHIPSLLYAGEHLSVVARQYIKNVFGTTYFGSAGYASVDAGPVGYQCRHVDGGIHHLFSDQVHLEVIDGEAVITSRIKRQMPVIRLRTGDLVEWISDQEPCPCGVNDVRFRLLGRANSQFNLWGCRLFLQEVEYALADCGVDGALFQVVLSQDAKAHERMTVRIEHKNSRHVNDKLFADRFYGVAKDFKMTHPRTWLDGRLLVEPLEEGGIERVARTGKIRSLLDQRVASS